jgi:riboflavin transporter FmnP
VKSANEAKLLIKNQRFRLFIGKIINAIEVLFIGHILVLYFKHNKSVKEVTVVLIRPEKRLKGGYNE